MCFVTNGLDYRRRPFYLKRLLFACHCNLQGVTTSFDLQRNTFDNSISMTLQTPKKTFKDKFSKNKHANLIRKWVQMKVDHPLRKI